MAPKRGSEMPQEHGGARHRAPQDEQLEAARARLYSRTAPARSVTRTPLTPPSPRPQPTTSNTVPVSPSRPEPDVSPVSAMRRTPKYTLRTKVLAGAVVFFLVALILSSASLFFGQNTISGSNIEVAVEGPFAIGGGEELELMVAVTNRNAVPVESATLIAEYPPGTQAADGSGRELFRERVSLDTISTGEVLNVPLSARLFGEENEEKIVHISVEYRVEGSNATFFKEAEPVQIKISSSPVVLTVDSVSEVSAGQEIELVLTIASNAPAALSNVLVEAAYPQGFDVSAVDPASVRGQNLWRIGTLESEAEETITITGVMTGGSAEERTFRFSVGVPNERDQFSLASVFATAETVVELTDPFVGLEVEVNNSTQDTVSVQANDSVNVAITFENTLADTIYDASISAVLAGSGLSASAVDAASGGFFNSSASTITWDARDVQGLAELTPGERQTVRFTIRGASIDAARTPQISFDVSVRGRRVSETRVPQELTNVVSRTVRFASVASLSSRALHSTGPFNNTGAMPPRAEELTQYTVELEVQNGSNELADAVVTTTLPSYVMWSDTVSAGDDITYNSNTREVTWTIDDMNARASEGAAFQVAFLPSVSQVGTVPTIVGEQRLRATDRFTGTVVRSTAPALTTRLSEDPDPDAQDGYVQP